MLKTLVATTALVLLLLPLSAHANLIWDWTGDCERITQPPTVPLCTHATLHVVTTDAYIPGEEVWPHIPPGPDPILLEALYSDGNTTLNLGYLWLTDGSGLLLPASFPGEGHMGSTASFFRSDVNGAWHFAAEGATTDCSDTHNVYCGYGVVGVNGVWTRVPAPSTLVLLGVGLTGLIFSRRRKVR